VSRGTARYLCIPEYTKRDERRGRRPEAISQERGEAKVFLYKRVNCCVKKKAQTMYIDALYRGVGQNFSTPEIQRARSSDTSRTTAKPKTSKTKTKQGKRTRKKSTEPKTNKKHDKHKRARNSLITNPPLPIQRPRPFLHFPEYHRVLSEMVTKRGGARSCRKEVRARLHREWGRRASDRR
jgi:hypothetical protein